MWSAIAGFALLLVAGLMLDAHRRKWQRIQLELPEERDRHQQRIWRVARAEYRRRMQASGTIAALGLILGVRIFVPEQPIAIAVYLFALLVGCLWVMTLGVVDAWASLLKMIQSTGDIETARLRLEEELKRAQEQPVSAKDRNSRSS